jgi:hypothetical protein
VTDVQWKERLLAAVVLKKVVTAKILRLAAANELGELVEQGPRNRQQTGAQLAVRGAFFDSGTVHWAEEQVQYEDQTNVHALMRYKRPLRQRFNPVEGLPVFKGVRLPHDTIVIMG